MTEPRPIEPDNVRLVSSRAIILNTQNRLLFARRHPQNHINPGLCEFLGGQAKPGESLWAARRREALEEACLDIEPISHADLRFELPFVGGEVGDIKVVYFGIARAVSDKVILSPEHRAYYWSELHRAYDFDHTPETVLALNVALPVLKHLIEA